VCLFCSFYFVCVQVRDFSFGGVVKDIGGRVLTLVAYESVWRL
jgi:hypothetical protein